MTDRLLTWFVPKAPAALRDLFAGAARVALRSGETFQKETDPYDRIFWVERGAVGQAVINHHVVTKPVAMNLYPEGSLLGFINLFSGTRSPRRLTAQVQGAELLVLPKRTFLERIREDPDLLFETARYTERAAKSELIGMEAIFTLEADERLALFFASESVLFGEPDPADPRFVVVPAVVTRASLSEIVYVSLKTLDRMLALCGRRGEVVRTASGDWRIRKDFIRPMDRWLEEH